MHNLVPQVCAKCSNSLSRAALGVSSLAMSSSSTASTVVFAEMHRVCFEEAQKTKALMTKQLQHKKKTGMWFSSTPKPLGNGTGT